VDSRPDPQRRPAGRGVRVDWGGSRARHSLDREAGQPAGVIILLVFGQVGSREVRVANHIHSGHTVALRELVELRKEPAEHVRDARGVHGGAQRREAHNVGEED
jgi:hypothetical protein